MPRVWEENEENYSRFIKILNPEKLAQETIVRWILRETTTN